MQLNTVSVKPVERSKSNIRVPTNNIVDYQYQGSYVGKKPKRKKKHRKKDREQPDLAAKLRAEDGALKKRRTDKYDGTTTSGSAAANILSGNSQGRSYTVSVAIPGSIVANAQSRELRTYLVGQVARSLAIFNIDEVIVYDDRSVASEEDSGKRRPYGDPCHFMARVLQYLETPQYLRKALFPVHEDLRYAGLLNPVDAPHHMRMDDRSKYREGVVLRPKKKQGDVDIDTNRGSLVDVGLRNPIRVDRKLQPNIRVTVEIDAKKSRKSKLIGKIVRPATPRTKMGIYWGYDVRLATSLSEVWTGCPYGKSSVSAGSSSSSSSSSSNGYDFVIGTSENGEMASGPQKDTNGNDGDDNKINLLGVKPFQHLLVVFGGLSGLESVVDSDEQLHVTKEDTSTLFDMYLNTCPAQGSRTIRTEEALLITMSLLRPYIQNNKTPTTNT